MATWGDSGDGQIEPNNYLHRQNATTATAFSPVGLDASNANIGISGGINTHNHNHNHNYNLNYSHNHNLNLNYNYNNDGHTNTNTSADTNPVGNGNARADRFDNFFRACDESVSGIHNLADRPVPTHGGLTVSPGALSLPNTDSLFSTVGDSGSNAFYTAPSTNNPNFPLFHASSTSRGPLNTAPSRLIPPTLLLPQSVHQGQHSSAFSPGQLYPGSGACNPYEVQQNRQHRSQLITQDPSWNPFRSRTAHLSFAGPSSPSHMSNANPQQNHPISQAQPRRRAFEPPRAFDDAYLAAFATQDFSSPSLPPLSSPSLPPAVTLPPFDHFRSSATGQEMPLASSRRRIPTRAGAVELAKEEPDLEVQNPGIDPSIPVAAMPPTTRRRGIAGATETAAKKRRASATSPSSRPNKSRRKGTLIGGEQPPPMDDDDVSKLFEYDDSETVDLSNATGVPAELMAPKVDNRVKLSKFQCVICMDDTTALTVTHCGHLFCSGCLHSSLHIDSMKRTCPVCRSKVDLKDKKGKTVKSYYHLELKVMTATKKGKRPAGA
ncbi:hypothetical protein GGS21DRAFT_195932 [Xylaria nigripes]|nr:hypothetical protein GGS21DRAFT_195932 [Xylaria nigripes]